LSEELAIPAVREEGSEEIKPWIDLVVEYLLNLKGGKL